MKSNLLTTLKEEINMANHANGTYIAVYYEMEDARNLSAWALEQGLTDIENVEDFHTTIQYSTQGNKNALKEATDYSIMVESAELDLFGENNDILVVRLDSKELDDLHVKLKNRYNFVYDFDEYKPHITIKYNFEGNLSDLTPPNMTLRTSHIVVEALKAK